MTDDNDTPTRDELAQRVNQLEETVQTQANVIRELLPEDINPDRRAVLKAGASGLGIAAAGALGYESGTQRAAAQSTDQVGTPSTPVEVHASTLSANKADVTGLTYARADRDSDSATITAGTWTPLATANIDDLNGELDTSQQFTPNESGMYRILAYSELANGTDGDDYSIRLQNITDSNTRINPSWTNQGPTHSISIAASIDLIAGKTYAIEVRNETSDFVVKGPGRKSRFTIVREIVHP